MRLKLYYKFFGIVFLSIVLSLLTAAITIGYFGQKNFHAFLEKTKIEEFKTMSENISKYYKQHGGFDELLEMRVPFHVFHHESEINFSPPPFKDDKRAGGMMPPPMQGDKFEIFTIFDANKTFLTGGYHSPEDMHIFPIMSDGKIVGYFGALKFDKMPNPFAEHFLKSQMYLLMLTTVIVMVLSLLTAFWLTRHMISPIRKLNEATTKVANRDFHVNLDICSHDELEDLAKNFQAMTDTLKEYEVKQARWISDISHELRTPLSVILGSIEAIHDGVRKADEETLDAVYKNTVRMKRLVNELHDITLAESGVMHLQKVPVNIVQELRSMLDFYEVRMAEYKFRVMLDCDERDICVLADVMRLNQVFINLLENTIKYAKSPGVLFVVCKVEKGFLNITFQDTGPGVDEVHLPHLFDRLYRIDTSRSRATGGSGLGLSICKYIIENHGGSIAASKGDKGGLRLDISLPLEQENE